MNGQDMTTIERVAMAMWKCHRGDNHVFGGPNQDEEWDDLPDTTADGIRELARAAIEAYRAVGEEANR